MTREEIINGLIHIAAGNWDENSMTAITEAITNLESQPSLPEGLKEAANEYASDSTGFIDMTAYNAFIAGAEYQRKQDQSLIELAEDHAMLAGMNKMKEEMMEKAVEGMVCATITGTNAISFLSPLPDELNAGDKVKVIFIKEDEI